MCGWEEERIKGRTRGLIEDENGVYYTDWLNWKHTQERQHQWQDTELMKPRNLNDDDDWRQVRARLNIIRLMTQKVELEHNETRKGNIWKINNEQELKTLGQRPRNPDTWLQWIPGDCRKQWYTHICMWHIKSNSITLQKNPNLMENKVHISNWAAVTHGFQVYMMKLFEKGIAQVS